MRKSHFIISRIKEDLNLEKNKLKISIELADSIYRFLRAKCKRVKRNDRCILSGKSYFNINIPTEIVDKRQACLKYRYNNIEKKYVIQKVKKNILLEEIYDSNNNLIERRYHKYTRR